MKRINAIYVSWVLALALGACDQGGKDDAKKDDTKTEGTKTDKAAASSDKPKAGSDTKAASDGKATAGEAKAAEGTAPGQAVTNPELQTYPDDVITKVADNCSSAFAIMATAPNSVGEDYTWTWTRQAMLANQQFKVVEGDPAGPGQVSFQLHLASDKFQNAWVLVAKCADGGTCNKLAAMYKGIVKNAPAQPVCGKLPMDLSPATFKKPVLRELGDSTKSLPDPTDVTGQCARLQACTVAMDPPNKAGKENIGFDCQKAPSNFKTACARQYPCAAVMSCLGG